MDQNPNTYNSPLIIMDESDEISALKQKIKELESANSLLSGGLPSAPASGSSTSKFIINPIIDTTEWEDGEIIDKTDELSGRVIFALCGINPADTYHENQEIGFHCGPETKDGALDDCDDCGLYPQLETLLKKFNPDIGAAENYHTVPVAATDDAEVVWNEIKKLLIENGAVEQE